MAYVVAFSLIFIGIIAFNTDDAEQRYPLYQGVDCSLDGRYIKNRGALDYYEKYCAHIVCEKPNLCEPYEGAYVYELPTLDYRGAKIVANHPGGSIALLRNNGGAITWGDIEGSLENRKDIRHQLKSDVREIHASKQGFAVLKKDGTLITWVRDAIHYDHTIVDGTNEITSDLAFGVDRLFSGRAGFAAVTKNNSVVTWRGDGSSDQGQKISYLNGNEVQDIVTNEAAWAALKKDGSVITWGTQEYGGMSESVQKYLSNVVCIYTTGYAFAALREDGTVVTWGDPFRGGYPGSVSPLLVNIVDIVSTQEAFAALREDGTVITWGEGGKFSFQYNVKKIVASRGGAFAALKWDNSVITWGVDIYGADVGSLVYELGWGVVDIYANYSGFAVLKNDGSVLSWGQYLSTDKTLERMTPYLIAREEASPKRIMTIVSSPFADSFFAIRRDGSFISWGRRAYPYHAVFYNTLDDPIMSKIYPDLEYAHYFDVLPKKRQ